jgi:hypothetical protein
MENEHLRQRARMDRVERGQDSIWWRRLMKRTRREEPYEYEYVRVPAPLALEAV